MTSRYASIAELELTGPYDVPLHGIDDSGENYAAIIEHELALAEVDRSAMTEGEIADAMWAWATTPGSLEQAFEEVSWNVYDMRFAYARSVTDFEITEFELGDIDGFGIVIDVGLLETRDGFMKRIEAEKVARSNAGPAA